ncbi:hypothetical protein G6O69_23660 [Pseudenhygromyxa sp. WMMC2535]|uniref:hypothetical protein n=1 Tax=Pseudenhygromyxa sp. WMMC2535 TaxID=2712867 RepID=UPI001555BF42|nr:hypothetical protein [Pseudenhygromyxa sp. WMMC2535]NVB40856.1 hypothetical protein [Pseudenhygromyxa sp. WMMC2535]
MANYDWYWTRVRSLDEVLPGFRARLLQFHDDISDAFFERADACAPGLIQDAHEHGEFELELGLRVSHMKSRIFKRSEGLSALADAIALLEFAHRPQTANNPFAVCAVDLLMSCYHTVDEAGYANERVAVAEEALAKLEPSAQCFTCINHAYTCALVDARRFEDALAAVAHYREVEVDSQTNNAAKLLAPLAAIALTALGRHEEGLAELEGMRARGVELGEYDQVLEVLLLARLERGDEAWALLERLDLGELRLTTACEYGRALVVLSRGPTAPRCDAHLDRLWTLHERACEREMYYYATIILQTHATVALARGRVELAARAIDAAQPILGRLRSPARMHAKFADLRVRLAAK